MRGVGCGTQRCHAAAAYRTTSTHLCVEQLHSGLHRILTSQLVCKGGQGAGRGVCCRPERRRVAVGRGGGAREIPCLVPCVACSRALCSSLQSHHRATEAASGSQEQQLLQEAGKAKLTGVREHCRYERPLGGDRAFSGQGSGPTGWRKLLGSCCLRLVWWGHDWQLDSRSNRCAGLRMPRNAAAEN